MSDVIVDKNSQHLNLKDWTNILLESDGQPERKEYMEDQFILGDRKLYSHFL